MNFKEGFPYNFNQNWTLLGFEKNYRIEQRFLADFKGPQLMVKMAI